MKLTTILALSLLFVAELAAQPSSPQIPTWPEFVAYKETSLSGAAEVLTVQMPATGGWSSVFLKSACAYCSVACVVSGERDGTAATGTALTPVSKTYGSPTAEAYHTSDVGSGSQTFELTIASGTTSCVELDDLLQGNDDTVNFSLRTDSITGTVKLWIAWRERQ